ncbi:hypothetical protein TrCOL_g12785 [Triparma columacea]|uniref:Uncharacterized protein n=1 Tax=Triparma columacea TaxID=722753 RepID=A0A9W7GE92_9STRA|nr:hypothetical protein TrCOL_g12785 [Triparma columacea]
MSFISLLSRRAGSRLPLGRFSSASVDLSPRISGSQRPISTHHLFKNSLSDKSVVEIIEDSSDSTLNDVYRLRFKVARKIMHLPRSHPAVIEFEDGSYGVKDELDSDVGTVHFVVRNPNDGNVIASIRTVDANTSKLDMEKFGWHHLSDEIKSEGAVEWCRLCASPDARGTTAAPMLYIQSVRYHQEKGNNNFIYMVDQKAKKLLNYYSKWTPSVQLTKDPVRCDEFEPGRKSWVLAMQMGSPGSLQRAKFQANVYYPAIIGSCFMKSYRDLPAMSKEDEKVVLPHDEIILEAKNVEVVSETKVAA